MRSVLKAEAEADGDERAELVIDVSLHRLRSKMAATSAIDGLIDALTFTGGVGEHVPAIRAGAAGLGFLGVAIDKDANDQAKPDVAITADGARARTFVVQAGEDVQIAHEVVSLPSGAPSLRGVP